jgi:hypothetical protein
MNMLGIECLVDNIVRLTNIQKSQGSYNKARNIEVLWRMHSCYKV